MSSNAQRFAQTVLDAFKAAGRHTDKEVGDAGGPSTTTMTKLRKVAEEGEEMPPPRSDTLRKIDMAADWAPGAARGLWEYGLEPTPAPLFRAKMREGRGREAQGARGDGIHIARLADRLLEVEERLDLLEAEMQRRSGLRSLYSDRAAYDPEADQPTTD